MKIKGLYFRQMRSAGKFKSKYFLKNCFKSDAGFTIYIQLKVHLFSLSTCKTQSPFLSKKSQPYSFPDQPISTILCPGIYSFQILCAYPIKWSTVIKTLKRVQEENQEISFLQFANYEYVWNQYRILFYFIIQWIVYFTDFAFINAR